MNFLSAFQLSFPLYALILLGFVLARTSDWARTSADALSRFVFAVAIPSMLLHLTSDFSRLPSVDARLLVAYFGGCLLVFGAARWIASRYFSQDGVGQTVFAMASIYGNSVLIGLPLAKAAFGEAAVPSVALILVTNSLVMWTLATTSVEWALGNQRTPRGMLRTLRSVIGNPVVASILIGAAWGLTGWPLPTPLKTTLDLLGQSAIPLALVTVGVGLASYRISEGIREAIIISLLKLVVLPLLVWGLAWLIGLPPLETRVIVLLCAIALGVNAYLMAREFKALVGPVGTALLMSTVVSAVTVPLIILWLRAA